MALRNSENAWVPKEKLFDYLLSTSHPIGKYKASFFQAHGYDVENVHRLERDLLLIARTGELEKEVLTTHGTKFVVMGNLKTPKGVSVVLRTVWVVETGNDAPRFVTAYPA